MIDYKKRLKAYLIDISILAIILFTISLILPNQGMVRLSNYFSELNELFIKGDITLLTYLKEYSLVVHKIDLSNTTLSIINSFFVIVYFVLYPFYKNGQTIGQKFMSIKIISENNNRPSVQALMIRNLIINGLGYMIISLSLLYLIPKIFYFLVISILGIIQLMIVIRCCFMIIYKEDKKGLQDVISKTYFIEEV
jgi:uncharacterized RDD family membrane protein YckC